MAANVTVRIAPGFEDALLRSAPVRDLVEDEAEDVATTAKELAPVDDRDLAESIHGDAVLESTGWVGRVQADDWKAHLWELGHHHPQKGFRIHPFLRPAAERHGHPIEAPRA